MPAPASIEEQTVAAAFILLYGNPPKSVQYRRKMFVFRNPAAHDYKHKLEKFVRAELPEATRTRTLNVYVRNRCLRYIMGVEP